jgi:DNA mismatch repair protein MSH3
MIQVSHPLCDQTLIAARLNAVSEIAESMGTCNGMKNLECLEEDSDVAIVQPALANILSSVLASLGQAPDIQRGITRIFHRTATPSEVINSFLLDVHVFHYNVINCPIFLVISVHILAFHEREIQIELNIFY